jgi:methyl-accepting chemotaxis protein
MNNLSLVVKIGGGFGLVLILLLIVSFTSWQGLTSLLSGLQEYRLFTEDTTLAGQLRQNLGEADATIKDFIISGSDASVQAHGEATAAISAALDRTLQTTKDPAERERLQALQLNTAHYRETTGQLVDLRAGYIELVDERLHVLGPEMAENLAAMMDQGRRDRDDVATYLAGMALRNLLSGQIDALNFLQYSRDEDAQKCRDHFAQLTEETRKISKLVFDDALLVRNRSVAESATAYITDFERVVALVQQRNNLVSDLLDRQTPSIAGQLNDIRENATKRQDEIGEQLFTKGSRSRLAVLVIAGTALLFGAGCAMLLTRVITGPILRTADFAATMAKGDFTQTVTVKQQDEIGAMAKALNSMVADLRTMLTDIINDTVILAKSSRDLKDAARQLTGGAEETSTKAGTVAAAAEEMSTNMQSVAGAMEESAQNTHLVAAATEQLNSTVQHISGNAETARNIAETAVKASQQTSQRMNSLNSAAAQIGKVTETITEISEQTNLLALNATIEAARAGEAGKGFAVVANEIKELARQTAEATVDIKRQIETMQNTTSETVADISQISDIINNINHVIKEISSAVDEQQAATTEIAGKVAETSAGITEVNEHVAQSSLVSAEITKDISEVNRAAQTMSNQCELVETSADQLNDLSARLTRMVERFTV